MIRSLEKIVLGGMEQWLLIRGQNEELPIILFLHGGPGFSLIPFAHFFQKLEQRFIVVQWDQRGTGKSFHENIPPQTMTLPQLLSDAYELVQFLKQRFRQNKLYLAGHSWGSLLGTHLAQKFPADFYAYIGIGQLVDSARTSQIQYDYALKTAREKGYTDMIKDLLEIGPPPFDNNDQIFVTINHVQTCGGGLHQNLHFGEIINSCTDYSERDKANFSNGLAFSCQLLWDDSKVKFAEDDVNFKIPVYLISGRYDYLTPFELVAEYFPKVQAPHQRLIWFENSAHFPFLEEPERFCEVMVEPILKETYPCFTR